MLLFFGSRKSRLKPIRRLKNTSCSYCQKQNTFNVITYSSYFHLFWIPLVPLFKTYTVECTHCKKTFNANEWSPDVQKSLDNENALNKVKRPLWQGCGCLVVISLFSFFIIAGIIGRTFYNDDYYKTILPPDSRRALFSADSDRLTKKVREDDTLTYALQQCITKNVPFFDTSNIEYATRKNDTSILVLLRIKTINSIEKNRKKFITYIENC